MASFDADLPVNNSDLGELKILGKKVVIEESDADQLILSRDGTTIELIGQFQGGGTNAGGTINAIIVTTTVEDEEVPTWDMGGLDIGVKHFFKLIDDGKLDKLIKEMFEEKDLIYGSHFDDTLFGFDGNDNIDGWRGDDKLNGGPGRDTLKGNVGDDTYVFDVKIDNSNFDTIEFSTNSDTIHLKKSIFDGFKKGELHKDDLVFGKKSVGDDAEIQYRHGNGNLYYDPDGKGGKDPEKFFNIGEGKDITHDNFFVV